MDTDPLPTPLSAALNCLNILCGGAGDVVPAVEFHAPGSWFSWAILVIIACVCLCLSAFVSGSEIAFFGLDEEDLEEIEEQAEEHPDNSPAAKVQNLLAHSERLLATILITNNLVNITMVVVLSFAINQVLTFNSTVLNFLVQTVFLTFLLLLFGEIFPKLVAKQKPLKWVLTSVGGISLLYRILGGPARLMEKSTGVVHRIISKKHDAVTTDELSQALEMSDEPAGKDKEMLEGILTFGEKEASDIMVSRVDITDIEWHSSFAEVVDTILRTGYSRIPVYDTTQDSIKGVLYSKDLLPYIGQRNDDFAWQSLIRKPYFVPESRMIDDLLEDFRRKHIHIAIVVDEFGGTRGIVTLEDIIEEIVGDIDDEYDERTKLYKKLSDDTFVFEAKIPMTDFYKVTGLDEEDFGDVAEDAETLAGLILAIKGDFPAKKESLVCGPCRFLVMDIQKHRIISVRCNIMN